MMTRALLAALILVGVSAAARSPCRASFEIGGAYPVVQAHEASPFSVGKTVGAAACTRIRAWLEGYSALHDVLLPFVATDDGRAAFESLKNASCAMLPDACEELRGMASGAGVHEELTLIMSLRHELSALARAPLGTTECTDVHTFGAFAHNEDGDPLLKQTAFYVNASVRGSPWHFAFRYPASLSGHAFGFNAHGLTMSMNALSPEAVDVSGVGVYFNCHAAFLQPSSNAVHTLLKGARSAYGGSLNVAELGMPSAGVNLEFGPGHGQVASSPMPASAAAPATFHMNDYLHLTTVPFRHDKSSEHRLKRARQLVSEVPATARNLTTLWRVLGDTADHAYPLYRHATAATATFDLEGGGMLLVHEAGSPLDAATRLVTFEMKRPRAASEDGDALPKCSWCEGGPCNPTCAHTKDELNVSITPQTGRTMPYWRPPKQTPLGVKDANVTLGVIIHHGSARNGDDYLCSMFNGLVKRFGASGASSILLVSPQVYELRDGPLPTELYWDANGGHHGERNWKWGGNSSADLSASISTFSVLDEIVATMLDKTLYPHLSRVLVAGHSAGGQIVMRYALASSLEVPNDRVRYFPANPSSYTYLDGLRPVQPDPWQCDSFCVNATLMTRKWRFAKPSSAATTCPGYDEYGYGLSGPLPPYLTARGVPAMIKAFSTRDVTYLSGSSDVCDSPFMRDHDCTPSCNPDDGGLDTSCEAYIQGKCRMARAHAYAQYAREEKGFANHRLVAIPNVGHSGCAVFQSPEALEAMFPQ